MKFSEKTKFVRLLLFILSIGFLTSLSSCLDPVVIERPTSVRGSFGDELYKILYDNTVNSPDDGKARAATFEKNKWEFIHAVNTVAPDDTLDDLNQVFKDIVPLYENFMYPATLRKIAKLLDILRNSSQATDALAFMDNKPSIVESPEQEYLIAHIYAYPELQKFLNVLLDLILKNAAESGFTPKYNATNQFLKALSIGMANMEMEKTEDSFIYTLIDRLVDTDLDFKPNLPSWNPAMAVKIAWNGSPRLNPVAGTGVYEPFVDHNNDHLPDTDYFGRFILNDGSFLAPYTHNPSLHPLLSYDERHNIVKDGIPVFEYFDLHQTPLAYLLREGDGLFADATLDDLLRATKSMLGKPASFSDQAGTYEGYAKDSPITQMAQGLLLALDHEDLDANLEALITLLKDHEETVAALLFDVNKILDIVDELEPNMNLDNNLLDVVLPILLSLSETPGLLEDLMVALNEPMSKHLGPTLAELAKVKKEFINVDPNGKYNLCFQDCASRYTIGTQSRFECIRKCPYQEVIGSMPVDRNMPETKANRSIFERICALMWETSGTNYEVYAERLVIQGLDISIISKGLGSILTMENLAVLYLKTLTGDMTLSQHVHPSILELGELIKFTESDVVKLFLMIAKQFFNVELSANPTTAEVTRFFNRTKIHTKTSDFELELTVADCKSGYKCAYANADTLFAMEAVGLVDALHPVVSVFNAYGQTAKLAELVAEIYRHYGSGSVQYTDIHGEKLDFEYDNLRSIEPVLVRALDETKILETLGAFADVYTNIQLSDGSKIIDRFSSYLTYLIRPDASIKNLKGLSKTTDPNGKTISPLSPAYLLIDPIREISNLTKEDPNFSRQLENGLRGLANLTIQTTEKQGKPAFEKPAGIKIAATALQVILDRYRSETEKGTRSSWLKETALSSIQDFISGRLPYAFFVFFEELDQNPEGLEMMRRFVLYLMQSGEETSPHIAITLYNIASYFLEQNHLTNLAHVFSAPLDPDYDWQAEWYKDYSLLTTLIKCMASFLAYDEKNVFNQTFYRLFTTKDKQHSEFYNLITVGKAVLRRPSGSPDLYTGNDYKNFLDFAYDLFTDDVRGVERIFKTIEFTVWGSQGRPYNSENEMPDHWPPERIGQWPPIPVSTNNE